jgi:16S rRNA (guanine(966)-N(2))-methyltransferase RsmD
MRVISGSAKGHKLYAPRSARVRPALDQVKEAIFNILFDVSDATVLDLFAGSGSVGIEALSRGAASCVFVEEWDQAIASIERNLSHCKLEDKARIIKSRVDKAIGRLEREESSFDLIFVDPPYEKGLVMKTLEALGGSRMAKSALIVVEHHPKEPIEDIPTLALTDSRKYGQTCVSFLKHR